MTLVGLLGGTFDPIHVGHLDVARGARQILNLDRVYLVPSRVPPHRGAPRASAAHRFAMAALAVQNDEGILVSDLEMEQAGPSYTAGTLDRLALSGWDLGTVCFITGADAFRDIALWKDYPTVLDRCHFAVVSRPGVPAASLRASLPELSSRMVDAPCPVPSRPGILLVDMPTSAVSSTDVRTAITQGAPLERLVPASVASYVHRHGLYR